MHRYQQPGFASARKQRRTFVPTDDQVETAKRRIQCTLEKFNGVVWGTSEREVIAFLERHVHNRGDQLGSRRHGHFRKVLQIAWRKLMEAKVVVFDETRSLFTANWRFDHRKGRTHHQKSPAGQLVMRAS